MKLTGEIRSTRRKTCPSATLSTTNPTWTDPGSTAGLRGDRPATNRLSHGTTKFMLKNNVCCALPACQDRITVYYKAAASTADQHHSMHVWVK
jgi:hypothetical protein